MRKLITKGDGSPTKSRVYAVQFLEKLGLSASDLIEEKGQFFYEFPDADEKPAPLETFAEHPIPEKLKVTAKNDDAKVDKKLTWETPVYQKAGGQEVNTTLKFKPNNLIAEIRAKHPAGQSQRRPYNAVEVVIGNEAFIMSLDLASQIFEVEV